MTPVADSPQPLPPAGPRGSPERPLRLLMVEDSPEDAELIEHELEQAGLCFTSRRAHTREGYLEALQAFDPDVVVSDYRLPAFDGREALRRALEHRPDLPVLIVTGALGDELAVELLRAGARDYVLKDRLARLPSSVLRALTEVDESRRRRAAETWLTAQRELLELVARGEELGEVLRRFALVLDGLLPGTHSALLLLRSDTGGRRLRLAAAPGLPESYRRVMDDLRMDERAGGCAAALVKREAVLVSDIASDPLCAACRRPGLAAALRSAWCFPLLTGRGEAVGLLVVHSGEARPPSPEERRLIEGAAPIAGLAIERARAEEAIRAAAEEWRATFDALEAAVLVLDENQRVVRANHRAARLLGAAPAECLDRALLELGEGEPWDAVRRAVAEAAPRAEATRVHDGHGRVWDVEVAAQAGNARAIVTVRDVTHLVRLQESSDRAQRMATVGTLVAGVAHEVRNPLFAMSVNIDALRVVLEGQADVGDLLEALCEERDRISLLMEDLLSYGRPTSSRRARGSLEPVLAAALRNCAALAAQLGAVLDREGSAQGLELLMDAGRLEEVFHNVLENACRHAPRGSRVVLRLDGAARPGWLRAEVRDQGPGFTQEALERGFEPFFTRRRGGTGLGLAIVQRIVEEHQGQVTLANDPKGGGVVAIELPLAPAG